MKRGKDEEKILEPMFPRLHVNDTDKGGPRAPPRNKMALYEQLSIPSQRFSDHGTLPLRSRSSLVHPVGSSSQPSGVERSLHVQHLDSSSAVHSIEKFVSQISMENLRSLGQHDQRKTVREEDDFSVPVFVNSRKSQFHDKPKSGIEMDKHSRDEVKGNTKPGGFVSSFDMSATEKMDLEASSCDRVNDSNTSLRQESRNRLDRDGGVTRVTGTDNGVESPLATESHLEEASDDVSDDSMVDSLSSVDVSPDDVVGVLGQKRFWRARKAIANQQRVFAVQLFELHRLIKVQRLIAASPEILLDDINFLGKISAKSYPVKKLLTSEFMVKPPKPQVVVKLRGDSEKIEQNKMECSAENIVEKLSNQGHHQPANYMPPYASNPNGSQTVNGLCFPPQPPPSGGNQQWLIPVMSPSEGLIYKPHPGLGHSGPVYGGYYGHFMPAPLVMGGYMGGGGPPPFHPGVGFPSPGNGYFPPYGMMPTMVNPYCSDQQQQHPYEQMNQQQQQQSYQQMNQQQQQQSYQQMNQQQQQQQQQQSYQQMNQYQQQQQQYFEQMNQPGHPGNPHNASALNTEQQSSANEAAAPQQQPTKPYPRAKKSRQGSSGSCPNGQEGIPGKNSFRPFSAVDGDSNKDNGPEQTTTTTTTTTRTTVTQTTRDGGVTRVIKVVPHNAKLASENAARIFRSIQEERKLYDSFSSHP